MLNIELFSHQRRILITRVVLSVAVVLLLVLLLMLLLVLLLVLLLAARVVASAPIAATVATSPPQARIAARLCDNATLYSFDVCFIAFTSLYRTNHIPRVNISDTNPPAVKKLSTDADLPGEFFFTNGCVSVVVALRAYVCTCNVDFILRSSFV